MNHPVFKTFEPDPIGEILRTGFWRFTSHAGIDGLARETGNLLEILAVATDNPGNGQFRQFIADCKRHYRVVTIWKIWNPFLEAVLWRYEFNPVSAREADGEIISGMTWFNPAPLPAAPVTVPPAAPPPPAP